MGFLTHTTEAKQQVLGVTDRLALKMTSKHWPFYWGTMTSGLLVLVLCLSSQCQAVFPLECREYIIK